MSAFCRRMFFVAIVSAMFIVAPLSAQRARGAEVAVASVATRVEFWRDDIVRVTHRPTASASAPSLVVIAEPQQVEVATTEQGGVTRLATAKLVVELDRADGHVVIRDAANHLLLAERPRGLWLSAAEVGSAEHTIDAGQSFVIDGDESLYGLGQHPEAEAVDLVGKHILLRQANTQVAVPVLLSSKGWMMLWDNPSVTQVDLGSAQKGVLSWRSEAGSGVDYYVAAGPKPDEAIAAYRWLSGAAPMFPRWAWGFWQSRERYKTQAEILDIVAQYRSRHIPLDGIIQDWQYWAPLDQQTAANGWGSHKFDPSRYPDPAAMVKTLHDEHAHLMVVAWAKFDVTDKGESIEHLKELEAVKGVYEPAIPYVYPPGRGKWYDSFSADARKIYWRQLNDSLYKLNIDAWWLDASEAELSGRWGEFRDFQTALGSGATVYNAYPLEHTRAMYEGQRSVDHDKRVFLLTRSAYAGQQRNAAVTWSGDISSKWETLRQQIPAGLTFVASGIPYWNTDIGGFFGNNPDDPKFVELFTRWVQYGSFTPMFRVHGTDKPKEIWRFQADTQATLTNFVRLRYHLLPYIYSTAWRVTHDGYTMMRPLVFDFADDAKARRVSDEFLFGPSLLISPVAQPGVAQREVYLPSGADWIDFWSGEARKGGQTISAAAPIERMPIFVRAGAIIPYGPTVDYADEKPAAPIELRVYEGADGAFTLYQDKGDGYDYERGAYATIPIKWSNAAQTLSIGERSGEYSEMPDKMVFHVVRVRAGHGASVEPTDKPDAVIQYAGKAVSVKIK